MATEIKLQCNLMALMVERGLTPDTLAQKSGVSLAYIQAWINDILPMQNASHCLLKKLTEGLDLDYIEQLFKPINKTELDEVGSLNYKTLNYEQKLNRITKLD